ncbi:MFS transporter [Methanobacterium petrolearium]|uniref:MFS transporter n=1 Tax=Methanobacterium petrolearium TaxID=710190 RepID=UPI001AEA23C0|nr:MFS transporter [Methanobacterium petrolearium]MBP1946457.1 EmrB/QacA subfamily drug resistance transporter [Methanobacterium petrolearium]BDZ70514.1 MFS transporter [Methanobacterium petrolearium]
MKPTDSSFKVDNDVKIAALLVASIASFFTPFMGTSINIALPAIGLDFGADAILLNWVTNGFLLAAAIFAVPLGRVADIHGMKKIFTYGIIIFTVASLFCALSPSTMVLIASRVLQGIGSAMIFVTGLAIITSVFHPRHRGKAIGINVAAVYVGLSLGPVIGGFMTQYLGWRSLFLLMIPFGLLVVAIVFWKLKDEWAASRGEKFDWTGSILYSIMLFLVMYGFSSLPQLEGWVMLIVGIAGFFAFLIWELRAESPVFNVRLFKNTAFTFSSMAALINYSATFAVTLLLSYYLQYIRGFEPQSAGIILVAQPILMAITAPIAGRMSDRIDARIIATVGMAIVTLGLFTFTFIGSDTAIINIIIGLAVLGLGFGLFSSPNTNVIMGSVERKFYGVASATVSTMRLIGQTMSIGIATLVFSLLLGRVQITPEQYTALLESIHICFVVFTVLCLVGIIVSWYRGKSSYQEEKDGQKSQMK